MVAKNQVSLSQPNKHSCFIISRLPHLSHWCFKVKRWFFYPFILSIRKPSPLPWNKNNMRFRKWKAEYNTYTRTHIHANWFHEPKSFSKIYKRTNWLHGLNLYIIPVYYIWRTTINIWNWMQQVNSI